MSCGNAASNFASESKPIAPRSSCMSVFSRLFIATRRAAASVECVAQLVRDAIAETLTAELARANHRPFPIALEEAKQRASRQRQRRVHRADAKKCCACSSAPSRGVRGVGQGWGARESRYGLKARESACGIVGMHRQYIPELSRRGVNGARVPKLPV